MLETTLAILAGGASSRMKSPKERLQIGGRAILEYLIDAMGWNGPTLLISAPGTAPPPGADRFDRQVFDPVAGLGPLRGVLTALENATTPVVVVATVDMPCIRAHHLQWLIQQLGERPEQHGIMMMRSMNAQRLIEPFPSAYRRSAAALIAGELAAERRAVRGLLKLAGFEGIDAPADWDARTWINLTTPEDLAGFDPS